MIFSKTPLRISFFGGGTDFKDFWEDENGLVLSTAINKYITVCIENRKDDLIAIDYEDENEIVYSFLDIQHDIIRECLTFFCELYGTIRGIHIHIFSDVHANGTGLGSSSSLTVGLLNALYAYKNIGVSSEELARQACIVEINRLQKPIGIQDQYIAAYGGIRLFTFHSSSKVSEQRIDLPKPLFSSFEEHLMLFHTGTSRKAESILREQKERIEQTKPILKKLKNQVITAYDLLTRGDLEGVGTLMKEGWRLKKQLSSKISNQSIDVIVDKIVEEGAWGAKVAGAGGGGYILIICPLKKQENIRVLLSGLSELKFQLENKGSQIFKDISYYQNINDIRAKS